MHFSFHLEWKTKKKKHKITNGFYENIILNRDDVLSI